MEKKYEASMAIQLLPRMGKTEMISVIDKVINHIKSKGLSTKVCPFETVVEGSLEEIMEVLKECFIVAEKEGATEFLSFIKISYNKNGVLTIDEKVSKYNK